MKDRGMQALYLQALDPVAETQADTHSYGFRKERSCADAITQCYRVLFREDMPTWILEGDIKSCFDKISHNWLLTHIPMEESMLEKWLKAGYMEKSVWHATRRDHLPSPGQHDTGWVRKAPPGEVPRQRSGLDKGQKKQSAHGAICG